MGDIVIAEDLGPLVDVSTAFNYSTSGLLNDPHLKKLYQNDKESSSSNDRTIAESLVAELGDRLSSALIIQDSQLCCIPPSDGNKDNPLEQFRVFPSEPLNATAQKNLKRCATFPCSGKIQSCPVSVNGISGIAFHEQSCIKSENPVGTQSTLPSAPLKLISAMKGSREKQGIIRNKLNVTWAPDVYDPPVTSASHAVTSYHQQRSRTSKKYGKNKHKGKSSRGSNSDKKQHHRRYIRHTDFRSNSLLSCDRMLFDHVNQATVDFGVNGQDSNCGSSFLRSKQAQLHISIAEAS